MLISLRVVWGKLTKGSSGKKGYVVLSRKYGRIQEEGTKKRLCLQRTLGGTRQQQAVEDRIEGRERLRNIMSWEKQSET